jgi:hypothetical protein
MAESHNVPAMRPPDPAPPRFERRYRAADDRRSDERTCFWFAKSHDGIGFQRDVREKHLINCMTFGIGDKLSCSSAVGTCHRRTARRQALAWLLAGRASGIDATARQAALTLQSRKGSSRSLLPQYP